MCKDFALNFGGKRMAVASQQHFPFHQGIFDQKQHDCRPPPTLLPSVSRIEIKLKGDHFDITEVVKAESQAVLNTITEYNVQVAFKNGRSTGKGEYARKRGPKLGLDQTAARVPEIMDVSLYCIHVSII
jgi:hypothetical protein